MVRTEKPLLTEKEMDAVELRLFCDVDEVWHEKNYELLTSAWKKLCKNAGDK